MHFLLDIHQKKCKLIKGIVCSHLCHRPPCSSGFVLPVALFSCSHCDFYVFGCPVLTGIGKGHNPALPPHLWLQHPAVNISWEIPWVNHTKEMLKREPEFVWALHWVRPISVFSLLSWHVGDSFIQPYWAKWELGTERLFVQMEDCSWQ